VPAGSVVTSRLRGPEQVFRVVVRNPVANIGVVVTSRGPGVRVEPRVVADGDENRLTGYAALPFDLNPYVDEFESPVLAAGASFYEATRLANYAGGLVVMKRGTATVSARELSDAVESDHDTTVENWSQEGPEQGRRSGARD